MFSSECWKIIFLYKCSIRFLKDSKISILRARYDFVLVKSIWDDNCLHRIHLSIWWNRVCFRAVRFRHEIDHTEVPSFISNKYFWCDIIWVKTANFMIKVVIPSISFLKITYCKELHPLFLYREDHILLSSNKDHTLIIISGDRENVVWRLKCQWFLLPSVDLSLVSNCKKFSWRNIQNANHSF